MAETTKKPGQTRLGKRVPTQSLLVALTALGISLQFTPGNPDADANANADAGTKPSETKMAKVTTESKPQKPDGSLDAGIHFKYDLKAQKEGKTVPQTGSSLRNSQQN